jgi:hypothetical protein
MDPDAVFVPVDFDPPTGLVSASFVLEPLGPQHNEADYAAWTSSLRTIRETPGFVGRSWPHEMSLAENLRDLEQHADDFAGRRGFTYTVLDPASRDVIGCVYIYPDTSVVAVDPAGSGGGRASVRSWVRADHAGLDAALRREVTDWLSRAWPFETVGYASRG